MFRATQVALLRSSRRLLNDAKFTSFSNATSPGQDDSLKGKVVSELKKALKINLVLVPILIVVCIFFFPTPSAEGERRMIEEYEKSAGWKT